MAIFSRLAFGLSVVISCLSLSLAAQAQVASGVVDTGVLLDSTQHSAAYYVLPISSIRKVNGAVGAEDNVYLSGQITRYTWQIMPNISAKVAHDRAIEKLTLADAKVVFKCHGRACGSSSQWANDVFDQSRLYGLATEQSYTALKQDTDNGPNYYALYSTQRGNRKVYLHLVVIKE
jgi:hypothetical protein